MVAISQAVVDPVVSKIDALLAAMEQRMPTATTLGAEIAAPLVAAVVAAVPPPPPSSTTARCRLMRLGTSSRRW